MEEIWKEYKVVTKGFNQKNEHIRTLVYVSNLGNINIVKWNEKPFTNNMIVTKNRKYIVTTPIYKLVWTLFNGTVPKGYVIHHIDHNKLNDRLDNLMLMTRSEHTRHHCSDMSEETKRKMSESSKQRIRTPLSEETKQRISKTLTNHKVKESTKQKLKGNTNTKNRKWFNNGTYNVMTYTCPDGFVPGRLPLNKNKS